VCRRAVCHSNPTWNNFASKPKTCSNSIWVVTLQPSEVQQFEHKPDPFISRFHDAQRVLARAYGYQSWSKLKAFVDGANIARFVGTVKAGDRTQARSMLASGPELIGMDGVEAMSIEPFTMRCCAAMQRWCAC